MDFLYPAIFFPAILKMLQPDVYWLRELEGVRLAIMPRPRSGEWLTDEIAGWSRLGVQIVGVAVGTT